MKIVCISDTHNHYPDLPMGDILIHAGDVSTEGTIEEIQAFFRWFRYQPHPNKILIGGNHDATLEAIPILFDMTGITYLHDDWTMVDDVVIAGSPVSRPYGKIFTAFTKSGQELDRHWGALDGSIDILITHGPPYGILDRAWEKGQQLGDEALFVAVNRIKPQLHIFGHIHGGYGMIEMNGTTFINASHCNEAYRGVNPPIVVEYPTRHNTPSTEDICEKSAT